MQQLSFKFMGVLVFLGGMGVFYPKFFKNPTSTLKFGRIIEDTHLKINCGGGQLQYNGATFEADNYFVGDGKAYTNSQIKDIKNTQDDELYRSERSALKDKNTFGYAIPVPNGLYEVKLHFAEIFWGATGGGQASPAKRVFSTALEGQWMLSNYDINAEVGSMTAVQKTYTIAVADGELNIDFFASKDQPKISAFEVDFVESNTKNADSPINWKSLKDAPTNKIESQCIRANNKMYLISGFTDDYKILDVNESYDPTSNTWAENAPIPLPVTHSGFALINNEIWIIAGFKGDSPGTAVNNIQIYNIANDKWREGPSLPKPYPAGAAIFYAGKLHYFGGLLPDRQSNTGNHYVLDINNQQAGWKTAAPLPNPRGHLSAAEINGIFYAIGGQHGHDGVIIDQQTVEAYDPASDTWSDKKSMPYQRSHFEPGTFVLNGQIVIVGGRNNTDYFYDRITAYDPQQDLWREVGQLPYPVVGPSAKMFDGKLVISNGGERGDYNPTHKTWSTDFSLDNNTLSVQDRLNTQKIVSIYPNPVNNQLHIAFAKAPTASTKFILTDLYGKIVLKKELAAEAYNGDFFIEANELSSGIYFLSVNQDGRKEVVKVIKK